ncbi:hypothetical protein [Acetivibrio cellulolyticus]|uniref:hypothetical protein n=1 Tax=Acetivibrio cellulolyticus TaxID=35830 RepID=UPI0001E305D0|nr:hypothetical protein [Acetivibrio cellulolyticus]
MKDRRFLTGVLTGLLLSIAVVAIYILFFTINPMKAKEIDINQYKEVLNNYTPENAVISADSAKNIGLAYLDDIYGKEYFTWSSVEYDKKSEIWIVKRQGFIINPLKVVAIDGKTGKLISAIGYKN